MLAGGLAYVIWPNGSGGTKYATTARILPRICFRAIQRPAAVSTMCGPYAAAHERPPIHASKGARTLFDFAGRKIYVECLRDKAPLRRHRHARSRRWSDGNARSAKLDRSRQRLYLERCSDAKRHQMWDALLAPIVLISISRRWSARCCL